MQKIYNYLVLKFNNKIIKIILLIFFLFLFFKYINVLNTNINFNFYDVVEENLSYISLNFALVIFYIVIIYQVFNKKRFDQYLMLRFRDKKEYFNINVLTIFLIACIFIVFINGISILECLGRIDFNNNYSEYFAYTHSGNLNVYFSSEEYKDITSKISPLLYIFLKNLFVLCYLFFLGMLLLIFNYILKKAENSSILVLSIHFINMSFIEGRMSFSNNIFFLQSTLEEISGYKFILERLLFWFVLLVGGYLIGRLIIKHRDYKIGE